MTCQRSQRRQPLSLLRASRRGWSVLVLTLVLPSVALAVTVTTPPTAPTPSMLPQPVAVPVHEPPPRLAQRDCGPRQSQALGGPQPAVPRAGGGFGTAPPGDCDEPRRHGRDRAPRDPDNTDHPAYQPNSGGGRPPRDRSRRRPAWAW